MADHRLALGLGSVVADHALACHDLAVQVVDALVQLCHAGGVGLGLGALVVQVKAGEVELTVGVFALTSGTQTYECLMVLVPVADGSVEGLTAVCDPAASKSWADKLGTLVASIEVTPAAGK